MMDHLMARRRGGVTILEATGELTLRDKISQTMADGSTQILLDMARMNRIDTFGVGELVGAYTSIVKAGGQLKLLHVPRQIKLVLEITRLAAVFELHEDEASAVLSFAGAHSLSPAAERAELGSEVFLG